MLTDDSEEWVEVDLKSPPADETSNPEMEEIWVTINIEKSPGRWVWLCQEPPPPPGCVTEGRLYQITSTLRTLTISYGWPYLKLQLWKNKWDVVLYGTNYCVASVPPHLYWIIVGMCYGHKFLAKT